MSILNIDIGQTNINAQNNLKFNDYLDYIANLIQVCFLDPEYRLRNLNVNIIIKIKYRYTPYNYTFKYPVHEDVIDMKKIIRSNIEDFWAKIKTSLLASWNINIDVCDVEYIGWEHGRGTHKFYFDSFNSN